MSTFGAFTVVRAGTKRVLNSSGVLSEVANNVPAFEFNTDGTYRGLLVEPAGTNLFLQSQTISVSPWAQVISGAGVAPIITATAGTAPDGTNTGTRIQLNSGGSTINDRSIWRQPVTILNATTYTCSIYVCATSAGSVGNTVRIAFEGTSPIASTTHTLTLGWQRVSVTGLSNSTSGAILIECRGTVTGQTADFLAWGAQLETGSVATSYIPTVASTANRVADSVTLTGASSLIGQAEGTLYVEIEVASLLGAMTRTLIDINDGTTNNRVFLGFTAAGSNLIRGSVAGGGASLLVDQRFTASASGILRVGFGFKSSDSAIYVNGVAGSSTANGAFTFGASVGNIRLGSALDGSGSIIGHIRSAVLFTTRLPNATLASLTA